MMSKLLEKAFGAASRSRVARRRRRAAAQRVLHRSGCDGAEGAALIAKTKRAVLAVEGGEVVGILTPKDLLTRVLAKDLSPDECVVGEVADGAPRTAEPDVTLIDALHMMHTGRFLHLPVVAADSTVFGVIDVKELAYSTMGGDGGRTAGRICSTFVGLTRLQLESGSKGSRSFLRPRRGRAWPSGARGRSRGCGRPTARARSLVERGRGIQGDDGERVACALLVQEDGLAGIICDHDIARKVVAPAWSRRRALDVATVDPQCVSIDDSAIEALTMMANASSGTCPCSGDSIVGVLNIARCLYGHHAHGEGAGGLGRQPERRQRDDEADGDDRQRSAGGDDVEAAAADAREGVWGGVDAQGLLDTDEASGQRSECCIDAGATVREAAALIAKTKRAVLAVEGKRVVGILTPKDLLTRVLAKDLSPDECVVSEIATRTPGPAGPDDARRRFAHDAHGAVPTCRSSRRTRRCLV